MSILRLKCKICGEQSTALIIKVDGNFTSFVNVDIAAGMNERLMATCEFIYVCNNHKGLRFMMPKPSYLVELPRPTHPPIFDSDSPSRSITFD